MYGLTLEMVMKTLLLENGYDIVAANSYGDFLGFDPEELVSIAREYSPRNAEGVDQNKDWSNLSCKGILDHYFKVDDLLTLPYNKKKGEKPVNVGIQWFTYSDKELAKGLNPEDKIRHKEMQLRVAWPACQEIYIDRLVLVVVYIPFSWEGLGFRTEEQNEGIKNMLYKLIREMRKPSEGPTTIRLSFDF